MDRIQLIFRYVKYNGNPPAAGRENNVSVALS
jgi:hypothetical protein